MKFIVKVLIAAIFLNGVVRVGMATLGYYRFKDAAQQAVTFGGFEPPAKIHGDIVKSAVELNLPIAPEAIQVRRDGPRTSASAAYTQQVELFPSYQYPFEFSFSVDAVLMAGLK
jgi:hypothetical protein